MSDHAVRPISRRAILYLAASTLAALVLAGHPAISGADDGGLTDGEARLLVGHEGAVDQVAFSLDGRRVLSLSGKDGTFRIWDAATGKVVRRFDKQNTPMSFALAPDGRGAVLGYGLEGLRLWHLDTGKELRRFETFDFFECLGFSADGRQMLVRGSRKLHLVDVETGKPVRGFDEPEGITGAALSADGERLLTGTHGTARLWDVASGSALRAWKGHSSKVVALGFSPDGRHAFTGDTHGRVIQWDGKTGKEVKRLADPLQAFAAASDRNTRPVAYTADFRYVIGAGVSEPYDLQLWDLAEGKRLHRFRGHAKRATAVAISPDGRQLVSGGEDNTVRLWTIPEAIKLGTKTPSKR